MKLEINYKKINEIIPYKNNPRKNDDAVDDVANSIKEFGFKVPIVIDKNNEIVAGHTRYKASKKLGLKEVPCIIADDLSGEQIKAFRLADNKVSEKAEWDIDILNDELDDILNIDMSDFGFNIIDDSVSYIDDLLKEEFVGKSESNQFSITFLFSKDYEKDILDYINENGKDVIADKIINFVKGNENA